MTRWRDSAIQGRGGTPARAPGGGGGTSLRGDFLLWALVAGLAGIIARQGSILWMGRMAASGATPAWWWMYVSPLFTLSLPALLLTVAFPRRLGSGVLIVWGLGLLREVATLHLAPALWLRVMLWSLAYCAGGGAVGWGIAARSGKGAPRRPPAGAPEVRGARRG